MTEPIDPRPTPPPPMTAATGALDLVRQQEGPNQVELLLHGELDATTCPVAEREIAGAQDERPAVLVVDLAGLTYLDSSGIRMVLLAQEHADDAGRTVAVRLGSGMARRLFDMLGLTDRLEVLDTHQEIDADAETDADQSRGTTDGRSRS
jgi:anti-anti-sigma factor